MDYLVFSVDGNRAQTFVQAESIEQLRDGMSNGKIVGMLGVEGCVSTTPKSIHKLTITYAPFSSAHQLGNSLAVLRMYRALGVKYVTLTHICHNAFADSVGYGEYLPPLHGGLRYSSQLKSRSWSPKMRHV